MKVFITGGTGTVGKPVVATLLAHGHTVTCTVKDSAARSALQAAFPGSPNLAFVDLFLTPTCGPQLMELAADYDCMIHAVHSFAEDYHATEEACLRAFIAAGKARAASGRATHFIGTTSTASVGDTGAQEVDETGSTASPGMLGVWRVPMERLVLDSAEGLFTTAIVRPVWIYGGSYVDSYVAAVKLKRKIVAPAVNGHFGVIHREDLAELYRIVAEKHAPGVFHGTELRPVCAEQVIAKTMEVTGVTEVERTADFMQFIPDYGYFLIGMSGDQSPVPRRALEVGWTPSRSFLDIFAQLYSAN